MALIDVDVAIRAAVEYIEDWNHVQSMYHRRMIEEKFMALPTVDAVPVVRCADCIWMQCNMEHDGTLPKGVGEYECWHWGGTCDPTDFCSYGKRKDGDHEKADLR